MKIKFRSSSAGELCTKRPYFDEVGFNYIILQCEEKASKLLKRNVEIEEIENNIENFEGLRGLVTVVKTYKDFLSKKMIYERDELPTGAITYLQKLWLENEYSFKTFSLLEQSFQLEKGNIAEELAITAIKKYYEIPNLEKNKVRVTTDLVSGECDMKYEIDTGIVIRDSKVMQTWGTFRDKEKMSWANYWQLISYACLFGGGDLKLIHTDIDSFLKTLNIAELHIDYVLLPTPRSLVKKETEKYSAKELEAYNQMQERISQLKGEEKIKTFSVTNKNKILKDCGFYLNRVLKAKEYYDNCTYNLCMKI